MDREPPPVKFAGMFSDADRFGRAMKLLPQLGKLNAKYRPWRKLKHIAADLDVDPTDAWCSVKWSRFSSWRRVPLQQSDGGDFGYCVGAQLLESLHRIDRATGGGGAAAFDSPAGLFADEEQRRRLRIRTLMDEAAESSLIEGAATTRKDAVEMLRTERRPRSKGETMVLNNYLAMQFIKERIETPLSQSLLLELQSILTRGTLENEDESGRLRRVGEAVRVVDDRTQEDIYIPPPAEALESRLATLCEFANRDHIGQAFIHPVVKACILHFMIGYEHPFADGNGRTARAVFYWYALRHGYRIFEYIPISERIRKGFAKYPQAYIDTELDDGDLTYFVFYKLDIIEQSLAALAQHLRREEEKLTRSQALLKISKTLNLRQRLLLEHALRHPNQRYTVKSHANSNGTTLVTARTDLERLVKLRLLVTQKDGREVIYLPAPTLEDRLAKAIRKKA